jgi:hypothetical protein
MRARIGKAFDGLGYFLGPAAMLLVFAALLLLLALDGEAAINAPLHLTAFDWTITMLPTGLAFALIVLGVIRRRLERNPRVEDFGFGRGIDPEFIERRLAPSGPENQATHAAARR